MLEMRRVSQLPTAPPKPRWPAGPGPRWRVRLGGPIFAPAAIREGAAYVGNTDGLMRAVKVSDGSTVWTFSAGRPIYGEALATADAVYFACDNGYLFRLDRTTGKEVWRYDLGDSRAPRTPPSPQIDDYDFRAPAPLLSDGVIYIGAGDGGLHAVKADTGERVWRLQSTGSIRTTAALSGDRVLFSTMGGLVVAVDRTTGATAWSHKVDAIYTSAPAVQGNVVVIGHRESKLEGLDAASGSPLWKQSYWGSWIESTAVFRDGRGYIGSGDLFRVSAFDPTTGV